MTKTILSILHWSYTYIFSLYADYIIHCQLMHNMF